MAEEKAKSLKTKKVLLYSAEQTPPPAPLFFSSLQHMLLALSLGMAVPVSVARVAGLDLAHSASLLAAAFFTMGVATLFQTYPGKFLGCGYQSMSVSDSAALAACLLAAEIGGVSLVLGMIVFSGGLKLLMSGFTFRMRKFFPAEVTGTMIFILGINIIPSAFKNFLGTSVNGTYDYMHLTVAVVTLIFMLACTLFIKPLKPYTALLGIGFGFLMAIVTGVFDVSSLAQLSNSSLIALPIYMDLSYSFDYRALVPFIVVTIASVVDNIGDFTAVQSSNDVNFKKSNWKSIENGIRGASIGTIISGLAGGPVQSTATTNIGIANASGITSRMVAYVASAMLIVASFFPMITGALSMIPSPVLGAVLMYSGCYIMAGGFSALSSRELDDQRIFVIFLSIFFAVSTLMPGVYSFLPKAVAQVIVSPMVMGVAILMITTLLSRIGANKKFTFITGVTVADIPALNKELESICKQWGTEREVLRKLEISLDGLCEAVAEMDPKANLFFKVVYDELQLKLHIESRDCVLQNPEDSDNVTTLEVSLMMLNNMFDNVKTKWDDGTIVIDMEVDI
jgi:NCS2 family nucleobase:cation symporter-2